MPSYFLDTSALAKLYHKEPGSPAVSSIAADPLADIYTSRLAIVEMESVRAMKVRPEKSVPRNSRIARLAFQNDLASGRLKVVELGRNQMRLATRLLIAYAELKVSGPSRCAAPLSCRYSSSDQALAEFVAADTRLCRIAQIEGFSIINPV